MKQYISAEQFSEQSEKVQSRLREWWYKNWKEGDMVNIDSGEEYFIDCHENDEGEFVGDNKEFLRGDFSIIKKCSHKCFDIHFEHMEEFEGSFWEESTKGFYVDDMRVIPLLQMHQLWDFIESTGRNIVALYKVDSKYFIDYEVIKHNGFVTEKTKQIDKLQALWVVACNIASELN